MGKKPFGKKYPAYEWNQKPDKWGAVQSVTETTHVNGFITINLRQSLVTFGKKQDYFTFLGTFIR
jgi:hypothetical protein